MFSQLIKYSNSGRIFPVPLLNAPGVSRHQVLSHLRSHWKLLSLHYQRIPRSSVYTQYTWNPPMKDYGLGLSKFEVNSSQAKRYRCSHSIWQTTRKLPDRLLDRLKSEAHLVSWRSPPSHQPLLTISKARDTWANSLRATAAPRAQSFSSSA